MKAPLVSGALEFVCYCEEHPPLYRYAMRVGHAHQWQNESEQQVVVLPENEKSGIEVTIGVLRLRTRIVVRVLRSG